MVILRLNNDRNVMTKTPNGFAVTHTPANEVNAPTLLFIHGFLDDATVWDGVVASLAGTVATVRYDLPGFGTRIGSVADPQTLSLESLATEAGDILYHLDAPVILVGQSLGAQVAELLAAERPDRVRALVLLTPAPLGGTHLPDEALAPFRALGGQIDAQRRLRAQLSPNLSDHQLGQLARIGGSVEREVTAHYVDLWNRGVTDAPATSAFNGPVLIIRGAADGFVTEQLIDTVSARFVDARVKVIDRGGHWLHVAHPEAVASMIQEFTQALAGDTTATRWRRDFTDKSDTTFADGFADDIALEASVLAKPIRGKAPVAATLAAASSIYESLEFTAEITDNSTSYLQWRATAFGGVEIKGVTVLQRRVDGRVVAAAIHHRPLDAVLEFSATIRDRLAGVVPADHFFDGDPRPRTSEPLVRQRRVETG